MKNNIVIRVEEKSEYRKVENLVRAALSRQASMVSVIMDCQREKMHRSFCVKNLYRGILMGLLESMQHRKAIL